MQSVQARSHSSPAAFASATSTAGVCVSAPSKTPVFGQTSVRVSSFEPHLQKNQGGSERISACL